MPQPKETPQRKRRKKAVPVLEAAGLSLSLASGASPAMVSAHPLTPVNQQMTPHEEQISDVSLAAFHVFDKETVGTQQARVRVAAGACGIGLYYPVTPPPVLGAPVYAPWSVRPAHKYRHLGPVRPAHKYR